MYISSVGQITSYNSLSQSSTPVPTTSSMTAATQLYNNNIRDDIDEVRPGPGFVLDNYPERVELAS